MDHDVIDNERNLPNAHETASRVTTVLVCENNLIRSGISHVLAETHFLISEDKLEQTSEPATLCLVYGSPASDDLGEAIEQSKAQWPSARVVLLAETMESAAVVQAMRSGLDGLCSTAMSREALIKALELVMLGETFIAPELVFSLWHKASRQSHARRGRTMVAGPKAAIAEELSERETQILRHLTLGASNKHIARELGLAEATVKVHIKAILRKVKAANRTQAAMWAQQYMNVAANDVSNVAAE
jgi:two-component system nitrate/nitrite response regulator NarL